MRPFFLIWNALRNRTKNSLAHKRLWLGKEICGGPREVRLTTPGQRKPRIRRGFRFGHSGM